MALLHDGAGGLLQSAQSVTSASNASVGLFSNIARLIVHVAPARGASHKGLLRWAAQGVEMKSMSPGRLAAGVLAAPGAGSVVPHPARQAAAVRGAGQLTVFGGRSAAQLRSGVGRKLDASL